MRGLKERTKKFALEVIKFINKLPRSTVSFVMSKQIIRSATSVGANYRAACRARSKPEFIAKMGIVEEEADESLYWLELIVESGLAQRQVAAPLMKEIDEITAMVVASIKTAKKC
ncbi:four helix bundle protein [Candidatus Margulisiibacteriota bacterium]